MRNSSRYHIFLAGLLFALLMSFFFWYANYAAKIKVKGVELKKSGDLFWPSSDVKEKKDTVVTDNTSMKPPEKARPDTMPRKILLIGDSQVEGLRVPFYDYCVKNKHTLLLAATWYSATDMLFGSNDTLKNIISRYQPDYILFVIGLNEIFTSQLEPCEQAVKKILTTFDSIPYAWVGPANWLPDKGINDLYQKEVPAGCFFLSKNLVLQRAKDGRHPSETGNKIWMDSIAHWLEANAYHRLRMQAPDSIIKNRDINDWMQLAQ